VGGPAGGPEGGPGRFAGRFRSGPGASGLSTLWGVPTSSRPPGKGKGKGCALRLATAVIVLIGAGVFLAEHFSGTSPSPAGCTVATDGGTFDLTPEQASNAATIAAVATSRDLPQRALTIALATSLQESGLENLDHGDRDSLGLFQQRPSQGWGTARQILDPVHASNAFFDSLVKIDGYTRMPLTVAAQKVQKSGFPDAYAQHESDATLLSTALTGQDAAALSCTTGANTPYSAGGRLGDPHKVSERLTREFGTQVRPTIDAAPRTVAVPAAPAGGTRAGSRTAGTDTRRGWELAQWAVAHAHELKVEQVSFGGMVWQAAQSDKGWHKQKSGGSGDSPAKDTAGHKGGPDAMVRITVAR
jgi:hypothetical protein